MSKAYPSNLSQAQFDYLNDLLPDAKSGGCPRQVDLWEVLNAIFYVLVEGCSGRGLPADFPAWQPVYTYFWNWRKDGTWIAIHDRLRKFTCLEQERPRSPTLREASCSNGRQYR
ncbi:transposase [Leptothermofonsia sichuanensis]|uniref:transposase n=1 Tax=Leptothermofonsia sichuanensis TaxID=2917832 RepID=UPI0036F44C9A